MSFGSSGHTSGRRARAIVSPKLPRRAGTGGPYGVPLRVCDGRGRRVVAPEARQSCRHQSCDCSDQNKYSHRFVCRYEGEREREFGRKQECCQRWSAMRPSSRVTRCEQGTNEEAKNSKETKLPKGLEKGNGTELHGTITRGQRAAPGHPPRLGPRCTRQALHGQQWTTPPFLPVPAPQRRRGHATDAREAPSGVA